ncbi:hypothetical protein PROFUN_08007 [Planoprotostelium fungivorum]|uniref:JmjC domain-containing protein n=1 Tax=Planoprotostelium fungivorum TaxID=1890364 RepID=A0A2P6MV96_9EUKA|nr:hypothetical protein PROFUN_08007 [Planoprotostelium fungivorum]
MIDDLLVRQLKVRHCTKSVIDISVCQNIQFLTPHKSVVCSITLPGTKSGFYAMTVGGISSTVNSIAYTYLTPRVLSLSPIYPFGGNLTLVVTETGSLASRVTVTVGEQSCPVSSVTLQSVQPATYAVVCTMPPGTGQNLSLCSGPHRFPALHQQNHLSYIPVQWDGLEDEIRRCNYLEGIQNKYILPPELTNIFIEEQTEIHENEWMSGCLLRLLTPSKGLRIRLIVVCLLYEDISVPINHRETDQSSISRRHITSNWLQQVILISFRSICAWGLRAQRVIFEYPVDLVIHELFKSLLRSPSLSWSSNMKNIEDMTDVQLRHEAKLKGYKFGQNWKAIKRSTSLTIITEYRNAAKPIDISSVSSTDSSDNEEETLEMEEEDQPTKVQRDSGNAGVLEEHEDDKLGEGDKTRSSRDTGGEDMGDGHTEDHSETDEEDGEKEVQHQGKETHSAVNAIEEAIETRSGPVSTQRQDSCNKESHSDCINNHQPGASYDPTVLNDMQSDVVISTLAFQNKMQFVQSNEFYASCSNKEDFIQKLRDFFNEWQNLSNDVSTLVKAQIFVLLLRYYQEHSDEFSNLAEFHTLASQKEQYYDMASILLYIGAEDAKIHRVCQHIIDLTKDNHRITSQQLEMCLQQTQQNELPDGIDEPDLKGYAYCFMCMLNNVSGSSQSKTKDKQRAAHSNNTRAPPATKVSHKKRKKPIQVTSTKRAAQKTGGKIAVEHSELQQEEEVHPAFETTSEPEVSRQDIMDLILKSTKKVPLQHQKKEKVTVDFLRRSIATKLPAILQEKLEEGYAEIILKVAEEDSGGKQFIHYVDNIPDNSSAKLYLSVDLPTDGRNFIDFRRSVDNYVSYMSNNGWGGQLELMLFAQQYNVDIWLYDVRKDTFNIHVMASKCVHNTAWVLARVDSNHYVVMMPNPEWTAEHLQHHEKKSLSEGCIPTVISTCGHIPHDGHLDPSLMKLDLFPSLVAAMDPNQTTSFVIGTERVTVSPHNASTNHSHTPTSSSPTTVHIDSLDNFQTEVSGPHQAQIINTLEALQRNKYIRDWSVVEMGPNTITPLVERYVPPVLCMDSKQDLLRNYPNTRLHLTALHTDAQHTTAVNIMLNGKGSKRWIFIAPCWMDVLYQLYGYKIGIPEDFHPDEQDLCKLGIPYSVAVQTPGDIIWVAPMWGHRVDMKDGWTCSMAWDVLYPSSALATNKDTVQYPAPYNVSHSVFNFIVDNFIFNKTSARSPDRAHMKECWNVLKGVNCGYLEPGLSQEVSFIVRAVHQ